MTDSNSESSEPTSTRRDVLRSVGGVGFFGAFGTVFKEKAADDRVPVNVGYRDGSGLTAATAFADTVLHRYAFDAATVTVSKRTLSGSSVQTLANNDSVRYVEPDRTMHALDQSVPWGVDRVDADAAHDQGATGSGGDIAIIDTGIDSYHPDLQANLGEGKAVTAGIGILSTESEQTKAERQRARATRKAQAHADEHVRTQGGLIPDWQDDNGHGTHCAGIADAVDNSQGVVGVSTETTLHPVKVLNALGAGSVSDIAAGIEYVAQQGWDVGSMSLGASQGSSLLRDACTYAIEQGTLLVAATGNSGPCTDCVSYPAVYPDVVGVGATTQNDNLAEFSSTGPEVDLVAPGKDIRSTYLSFKQPYQSLSGTSMACPHVAGAGGLLMAEGDSNADAADQLTATAEDIGLSESESGAGLLNVPAALGIE